MGRTMHKRIPADIIREVCRPKRDEYPDYSVQHFHERLEEDHHIEISYTWTRVVLDDADGQVLYARFFEEVGLV
jgi:hypothetical protein